ncbi:Uncharacterized protein FWK35_00008554 [Aphis craccivora]|uniref:Uncharacterized protein n=1 Tax=Aphis craccivora TaxID=307492 RepID=A0A6G0ZJ01_APHCR|nr:Uncharacterized protein FWK35_00008554 [Aphis craccivora]
MIITSRNNAPTSNFGGGFRWKSEYPWCIIELNFQKFLTFFDSNLYEICRKRENLERNDNDLSSNDFKYFISRRYLKILPLRLKITSLRNLKHTPVV